MNEKYLLVPIPKSPYFRVGPDEWQDWHRQVRRTIAIARRLRDKGAEVSVIILSSFQSKGRSSEIEIYTKAFHDLAPGLDVRSYKETNDTLGQVERSFELADQLGAKLVFISAWMQYPRVLYLARGRKALHYGTFGIPSPIFAFIDPLSIILQPIIILLGLGSYFQRMTVRRREKGTIW